MDTNPTITPPSEPPPPIPRTKINWLVFFAAMFVPTVVTILSVQTGSKDTPPIVALLGSGASGIVCGAMLGRRFGRTHGTKIAFGVVFILVMGAACVAINCFGCLATGYKLDFR